LIIGLFAVSSMVIKPLGGWGADRVGRRPIMLAGAALFSVSPVLYGWSHTVGALLGVLLYRLLRRMFPSRPLLLPLSSRSSPAPPSSVSAPVLPNSVSAPAVPVTWSALGLTST